MNKQNIAIIGLGRIGSAFLGAMLQKKQNINLVCVAERADTPAKAQAVANGIKIATLDEIATMGDKIDIVFELTGMPEVRKELREKLLSTKNVHTVIASETIARLIGSLISEADIPVIQGPQDRLLIQQLPLSMNGICLMRNSFGRFQRLIAARKSAYAYGHPVAYPLGSRRTRDFFDARPACECDLHSCHASTTFIPGYLLIY